MARYKMDDGTVVDTDRASAEWGEARRWNGNNHISVATGSQWSHETLYRSSKGRYYVERSSQWQGSLPSAIYIDGTAAAAWLVANGHDVPDDLAAAAHAISE